MTQVKLSFADSLVAGGYVVPDPLDFSPLFAGPAACGTSGYPLRSQLENYIIAHVYPIAEAIGKCAAAL